MTIFVRPKLSEVFLSFRVSGTDQPAAVLVRRVDVQSPNDLSKWSIYHGLTNKEGEFMADFRPEDVGRTFRVMAIPEAVYAKLRTGHENEFGQFLRSKRWLSATEVTVTDADFDPDAVGDMRVVEVPLTDL